MLSFHIEWLLGREVIAAPLSSNIFHQPDAYLCDTVKGCANVEQSARFLR
jgi:hypothetical protein